MSNFDFSITDGEEMAAISSQLRKFNSVLRLSHVDDRYCNRYQTQLSQCSRSSQESELDFCIFKTDVHEIFVFNDCYFVHCHFLLKHSGNATMFMDVCTFRLSFHC